MSEPPASNRTAEPAAEVNGASTGALDETAGPGPPAAQPFGSRFGPPAAAGELGQLGPYRILRELGKGGMGAVYLALDTRLDRELALKVILPEFAADTGAKERFLREAKAAARISHDHVVTVYEADECAGVPYIAMQLLHGAPLDGHLKAQGPPPLSRAVGIARETALGLSAAHALGLIHRDVKPSNLWLEAPSGRVKVLDFGLVKPLSDSQVTPSGVAVGTPAYMSPEQGRGLAVDARTDLFSLGTVLYQLCTGRLPFVGDNALAVLTALGSDDPVPVRELNPGVPKPLADLIHQLLAKRPADRPPTAGEVAERLGTIAEALGASGGPASVHGSTLLPGSGGRTGKVAAARPRAVRMAGGAVLLVALAVGATALALRTTGGAGPAPRATEGAQEPAPGAKAPGPPLPGYRNALGTEFVLVGKGTGRLGGEDDKPGETEVRFEHDFYLGRYEVTQAEWAAVMGSNPSYFSRTGLGKEAVKDIADAELARFPVEMVSWDDCQLFVRRLNEREGDPEWVYRLPREAEWEYACRGAHLMAGADSSFNFYLDRLTNALLPEQANFAPEPGKGLQRSCAVGGYKPSALGLYDMHGNVWEWCDDTERVAGTELKVNRGGGWHGGAAQVRASIRDTLAASVRYGGLGLRLARVPRAPAVR